MQASQCTTAPRASAIFRQKSGRGFLCFSLSLALFPPFPFFRLSLFSAFPSFPRFFKKQKPLRRRESPLAKLAEISSMGAWILFRDCSHGQNLSQRENILPCQIILFCSYGEILSCRVNFSFVTKCKQKVFPQSESVVFISDKILSLAFQRARSCTI